MFSKINLKAAAMVSALALTFVGCANKESYQVSEIDPLEQAAVLAAERSDSDKKSIDGETFQFGFDKYQLSEADKKMVEERVAELKENPSLKLRISGHTDAIGSREYNVALGERRAIAIKNLIVEEGISSDRLTVVSYGKEQPISLGDTEYDMAQNRRAVIDYDKS